MKLDFKFTLPRAVSFRAFQFPPQRYWGKFLILIISVAGAVLMFDILVFWKTSSGVELEKEQELQFSLRKGSLEAVYTDLERRRANFEQYLRGVNIKNPSE